MRVPFPLTAIRPELFPDCKDRSFFCVFPYKQVDNARSVNLSWIQVNEMTNRPGSDHPETLERTT